MSKYKRICEDLQAMPYTNNTNSAHEKTVQEVFERAGLTEFSEEEFKQLARKEGLGVKALRNKWLRDPESCSLPEGTFVCQPCGSQDSPDFIVNLNRSALFFECKSVAGKKKKPKYNGGYPRPGYIYIFCAEEPNQTMLYRAEDIVTPNDYEHYQAWRHEINKITTKYNENFKGRGNLSPVIASARADTGQLGTVNYFEHRDEMFLGVLNGV